MTPSGNGRNNELGCYRINGLEIYGLRPANRHLIFRKLRLLGQKITRFECSRYRR